MASPSEVPLPLPVARLKRRAFNAKSAKDRHDNAYFAFEVSVRLAVAFSPPPVPATLARATLGQWVASLQTDVRLGGADALRLFHLLTEVGAGRAAGAQTASSRQLFDALVAYRNKAVGHGAVRAQAFYESAASVLLAGLDAAWVAGVFLPTACQLLFVESIAVGEDGRHVARVLDLGRETPVILDPVGTPVSSDLRPGRIHARVGEDWRSLHPWILFSVETERAYAFNGLLKRPEYLDYASGEILTGLALDRLFPGVDAEVRASFAGAPVSQERVAPRESGEWIGEYRLVGRLGEGGMGQVYLAIQRSLDRRVALKVLPLHASRDSTAAARFDREIRALCRCEHPNVVKILDSGEAQGTRFYAMEYVEGADLSRVFRTLSSAGDFDSAVTIAARAVRAEHREALSDLPDLAALDVPRSVAGGRYRQAARIFRDAARGIQHIHDNGVIHRDVKPSNIMVTVPDQRAVVTDLGLALEESAPVSLTKDKSQVLGTLRYMSPEQLVRDRLGIDRRADVYSLGASLYEMLADRPFFDGDSEARLIEQVLREEPSPIETVAPRAPRDLGVIVRKATAKDPKLRYESAAQLAADLDAFLEGRPISARPPSLAYVLGLAVKRHKPVALAVAASLLVLILVTVAFITILRNQRDRAIEAESDALLAADRASRAESEARAAALQKQNALDDYERLGDKPRLERLIREARDLWPGTVEDTAKLASWVERAKDLARRLPLHEQALETLQSSAGAVSESRSSAESAPASRSRSWRFASETDQFKNDTIEPLVKELRRFVEDRGSPGGLLDVSWRLEVARELDASGDWDRAIRSIADESVCPLYRGLVIRSQRGLVPIGRDPQSGLWEFYHVRSAQTGVALPPRRGPHPHLKIRPSTGLIFVLLPGGAFRMGAVPPGPDRALGDPNVDSDAWNFEGPVNEVRLDPFFMSKFEMSQGQWLRLAGSNPSQHVVGQKSGRLVVDLSFPVEQVSWYESDACLNANGLFIPTEAQWEYAARAGTTTVRWTGDAVASLRRLENVGPETPGDTRRTTGRSLLPPGSLKPNPFGLYDVLGNLEEWCRDRMIDYAVLPRRGDGYREGAASRPSSKAFEKPQPEHWRVRRGCHFYLTPLYARSSFRQTAAADYSNGTLGVRPARGLDR
jgi:serine/threonine protein kinase/formylglycine-generating enzyme required for sulfatase activity